MEILYSLSTKLPSLIGTCPIFWIDDLFATLAGGERFKAGYESRIPTDLA